MGLNMEPRQGGTTALRKETEQQNSSHVAAPFWDTPLSYCGVVSSRLFRRLLLHERFLCRQPGGVCKFRLDFPDGRRSWEDGRGMAGPWQPSNRDADRAGVVCTRPTVTAVNARGFRDGSIARPSVPGIARGAAEHGCLEGEGASRRGITCICCQHGRS